MPRCYFKLSHQHTSSEQCENLKSHVCKRWSCAIRLAITVLKSHTLVKKA